MPRALDRRSILKCFVAVAASTAFGCSDDEDGESPIVEDRAFFPQSVASGDPRPESVVLWTRVVDPGRAGGLEVTLEVATDDGFRQRVLVLPGVPATEAHGGALKVKVTGLSPRTEYFYRFLYDMNGRRVASPVGRTRTAPAPGDDVPVLFAVANCQDYNGRYYNSWQRLLQLDEDLDFVIFLGDYIYETTPEATPPEGARQVRFSEPEGALRLPRPGGTVLAAASLSNYRDLYRTYRSDAFLQGAHERYPFVVTWDDHEFSDDSWAAHANYTEGRQEELQAERRRDAELAFFEYMPLDPDDVPQGPIDVDAAPRYPNTRIWRGLDFGTRLRLIVTDYRSQRPDHLVPEDAWPAAVAVDAAALSTLGVANVFTADTFAYVDISAPEYAEAQGILRLAYQQQALAAGLARQDAESRATAAVRGPHALAFVNPVLVQAGRAPIDPAGKPRGLAFVHLGKTGLFSRLGARYVVVQQAYDVYAAWRDASTGGEAQNVFGEEQSAFVLDAAAGPQAWKVLVSSVSATRMLWDLSNKPDVEPATVRNRYYFDVDQWDGVPQERARLLGGLRGRASDRAVVVSGDIHASFASVEHGVPALTAPAISSSSVQEEAAGQVAEAGFPPGTAVYRYVVTEQAATLREGNPGIAFVDTDAHGFTVVEVGPDALRAAWHLIPGGEARTSYADRPEELAARFTRRDFSVTPGAINVA